MFRTSITAGCVFASLLAACAPAERRVSILAIAGQTDASGTPWDAVGTGGVLVQKGPVMVDGTSRPQTPDWAAVVMGEAGEPHLYGLGAPDRVTGVVDSEFCEAKQRCRFDVDWPSGYKVVAFFDIDAAPSESLSVGVLINAARRYFGAPDADAESAPRPAQLSLEWMGGYVIADGRSVDPARAHALEARFREYLAQQRVRSVPTSGLLALPRDACRKSMCEADHEASEVSMGISAASS